MQCKPPDDIIYFLQSTISNQLSQSKNDGMAFAPSFLLIALILGSCNMVKIALICHRRKTDKSEEFFNSYIDKYYKFEKENHIK